MTTKEFEDKAWIDYMRQSNRTLAITTVVDTYISADDDSQEEHIKMLDRLIEEIKERPEEVITKIGGSIEQIQRGWYD